MKTIMTHLKTKSIGLLTIFSLALASCGSYTGVSYYAHDGIYSSPNTVSYEVTSNERGNSYDYKETQNSRQQALGKENPNEFGSYFSERANTYSELLEEDVITSADQYMGNSDMVSANGQEVSYDPNNKGQAAWGANTSQITVQVHNNPWFDQFYPGSPAAFWGNQGFYANRGWGGFNNFGWGGNNWNLGFNNWGYDPWGWGFNNFGFNNWGWNGGWGMNNWGWGGGWAFNNPAIFYGSFNYNRVQRYARINRFNQRSPYRSAYAVNATRRGRSNQESNRNTTYALRKNTLSVSGLRTYLRTSDNARVVDAYRMSNTDANRTRNSAIGALSNNQTNGLRSNNASNLRNSNYNRANSVITNSIARTPRATRSNPELRSTQNTNNQLYRNLAPRTSNYNNGAVRSTNASSASPIRRSAATTNEGRSSNYRSSNTNNTSNNIRSSAPTRTSSSNNSGRSSNSSGTSSRSSSSRSNNRKN